jgi:hypothetical protein
VRQPTRAVNQRTILDGDPAAAAGNVRQPTRTVNHRTIL